MTGSHGRPGCVRNSRSGGETDGEDETKQGGDVCHKENKTSQDEGIKKSTEEANESKQDKAITEEEMDSSGAGSEATDQRNRTMIDR